VGTIIQAWYGMVNVDLYSAIITKVSNALISKACGISSYTFWSIKLQDMTKNPQSWYSVSTGTDIKVWLRLFACLLWVQYGWFRLNSVAGHYHSSITWKQVQQRRQVKAVVPFSAIKLGLSPFLKKCTWNLTSFESLHHYHLKLSARHHLL